MPLLTISLAVRLRFGFLLAALGALAPAAAQPVRTGIAGAPGPGASNVVTMLPGLPPNGLTGQAPTDYFGASVASAGDLNGDGYDDVVVGAYGNDAGGTDAGRAYVYFGGPSLTNTPDLTLTGAAGDNLGYSVAGAGDVNGDGFDDVVVGAQGYGGLTGRAYVYFGGAVMNNTADVTLTGAAASDQFGNSVAGAGDVNGDGFDDVVVGALGNDNNGTDRGRAYVYFGGAAMNATADVTLSGQAAGDLFGLSVAGAGDTNGDGYADVAVGAPYNDAGGTDAGRAYVYLGGAAMDNTRDVIFIGQAAGDYLGWSVAGAGDANDDGFADVAVGAWGNDGGGADAGRAYVYFGGAPMNDAADLTMTGQAAGDNFGFDVAGVGDVDGDGYDDLATGGLLNDAAGTDAGRAYVYHGGPGVDSAPDDVVAGNADDQFGLSVAGGGDVDGDGRAELVVGANKYGGYRGRAAVLSVRLTGVDLPDAFFTGAAAVDELGYSVSGAGDVNGDGFNDVVVGAPYGNDAAGMDAGRAYIYFGGPAMDSAPDVTMTGAAAFDNFGLSVSGAGDVNGDGFSDVVVGAYGNDAGGTEAGRAYVFFGGAAMDNAPDVTMTGQAPSDFFGNSVSGAGDVNGDGYSDVVVGTPYNDIGGTDAGRAYVYFGGATMDNTADVTMPGVSGEYFGWSVSDAGDVNGDGYGDVVVGGIFNDAGGSNAGRMCTSGGPP